MSSSNEGAPQTTSMNTATKIQTETNRSHMVSRIVGTNNSDPIDALPQRPSTGKSVHSDSSTKTSSVKEREPAVRPGGGRIPRKYKAAAHSLTQGTSPLIEVSDSAYEGHTTCEIDSQGRIMVRQKDDLRHKGQHGKSVICKPGLIVSDHAVFLSVLIMRCAQKLVVDYLPCPLGGWSKEDGGHLSEVGLAIRLGQEGPEVVREIIKAWDLVVPRDSALSTFFRTVGDAILCSGLRHHICIRTSDATHRTVLNFLLSLPFVTYTRNNASTPRPAWLYTVTDDEARFKQLLAGQLEGCWICMTKSEDTSDLVMQMVIQSGHPIVELDFTKPEDCKFPAPAFVQVFSPMTFAVVHSIRPKGETDTTWITRDVVYRAEFPTNKRKAAKTQAEKMW
ncbi:hypothetical protein J8273_1985 [Carpediemonas membranifera]|uniref:Uncharacterized protein n=1 Tax=Carpediemonas membranifera TaxID=201153 RepID=A0A8J6AWZ0_9EUKA|nr:hypothetical protein J8273_1985 [Carpediemonas membranifera]|eukprot:KAG9396931.1 hypothetical protein J8273_1985 [Carpediemonas membranifera]